MSTDEYRSESFETTKSSEEAQQHSESDQLTDQLFPLSEVEREIEDEHYEDFKTFIEMLVEIGDEELRPLKLSDCYTSDRPGMYFEILPKIIFETMESETGEEIDFPKPIFRMTVDQGTIASVEHASNSAQTSRSKLLNSWSQYEPRLCSEEDCVSAVQSEGFKSFIKTAEIGITDSLVQNRIADSFSWELKSLLGESSDTEASKESTMIMSGSFVCFEGDQKQIINSISWHPVLKDIFIASTLRNIKFESRLSNSLRAQDDSYLFYVWSCKNQFMHKVLLEYFDEILLHKFNPTIPKVVAGGSLGGQLILWNIEEEVLSGNEQSRKDSLFAVAKPFVIHHSAISNPEYNHIRGITDLAWLPNHMEVSTRGNVKLCSTNETYQIATYGTDGHLKFWDLRAAFTNKPGFSLSKMYRNLDAKWEPVHSMEILEEEKKSLSITKFALKEIPLTSKIVMPSKEEKKGDNISTEFFAGCDDGQIICGDFKLFRDETGKFKSFPPKFYKSPHSGSITAISVSPFFSDMFLSSGARTVAVWRYGITATPLFSRDMHAYITSAEWSNCRPALLMLGYQDGSIEMWDLLNNIYEPALIHFVSTTSITAISIQTLSDTEHIVAVGDSEGIAYTLSLPSSLTVPVDNEVILMQEFLMKEGTRMQSSTTDFGTLVKAVSRSTKTERIEKISLRNETISHEVLEQNYADYLEIERTQLKLLGLIEEHVESEENIEN